MKEVFDVKRSADGDDVLKKLNGQYKNCITVTNAARTLEDVESGSIVFCAITGSSDVAITLPAPAAGLYFTFINAVTPSGSGDAVITPTTADTIVSMGNGDADADGFSNLLADSVTIEAASVGGERIELVSDGTYWYSFAFQNVVGSITTTG
tara:strand:+ start:498 stop:953 length:456 start_codon:yes stop_codon:yes gene_type:complete